MLNTQFQNHKYQIKPYIKQLNVTIVIDAFRAFATASYVLARYPKTYMLATKSFVISKLASNLKNTLLIGKAEKGSNLIYNIPNSPSRTQEVKIRNKNILHRTEAGAKGILLAKESDIILAVGFVNADATVKYIKNLANPKIKIVPMGHEAVNPSLEDDLCAMYIESLIQGKKLKLTPFLKDLKKGPGKYFFSKDQWQYPQKDFDLCLKTNSFNFAIKATVHNDYAILKRCNIT
ncbi:MAG: 2-phosphosulfolactate phosphatase [Candidatus Thorarchaeota archaeon]